MDSEVQLTGSELICQFFELGSNSSFEATERLLTERIIFLLLNDFEKLWGLLYRFDVNEQKVKALFDAGNPHLIAPGISKLVIERALEKAQTRILYRGK